MGLKLTHDRVVSEVAANGQRRTNPREGIEPTVCLAVVGPFVTVSEEIESLEGTKTPDQVNNENRQLLTQL